MTSSYPYYDSLGRRGVTAITNDKPTSWGPWFKGFNRIPWTVAASDWVESRVASYTNSLGAVRAKDAMWARDCEYRLKADHSFYNSSEYSKDPDALHPATAKLVDKFAAALKAKLLKAQKKYGYSDNWKRDDWEEECQKMLLEHVAKGDPLDVAAYTAFMWHHNYATQPQPIEWGDVIYVNGAKNQPVWLRGRVRVWISNAAGAWDGRGSKGTVKYSTRADRKEWSWKNIPAIRLEANHPYYELLKYEGTAVSPGRSDKP